MVVSVVAVHLQSSVAWARVQLLCLDWLGWLDRGRAKKLQRKRSCCFDDLVCLPAFSKSHLGQVQNLEELVAGSGSDSAVQFCKLFGQPIRETQISAGVPCGRRVVSSSLSVCRHLVRF